MKTKSFLRILITSFACAVIGVTPWWLLCKYIIKVDCKYLFLFALVMGWFAMTVGAIIREKPEKERERIAEKFIIGFAKSYMIYISIAFVLVVALLILALSKVRM
jgi:hypothetical protein